MPETSIAALCEQGVQLMRSDKHAEALAIWQTVQKQAPDEPMGFSHAALAHIYLGQLDAADMQVREWLARSRDSHEDRFSLAREAFANGNSAQFMPIWRALAEDYANSPQLFYDDILEMIKANFSHEAVEICDLLLANNKANFNLSQLAIMATLTSPLMSKRDRLEHALDRCMELGFPVSKYSSLFCIFLNALHELCQYKPSLKYVHREYLYDAITMPALIDKSRRFDAKIAFYIRPLAHLPYFQNIIKYLGNKNAVIITDSKNDTDCEIISFCDLQDTELLYGKGNLSNYQTIVAEQTANFQRDPEQRIIGLFHSNMLVLLPEKRDFFDLVIFQYQRQALSGTIAVSGDEAACLPGAYKREIAYTGPYNMDDFASLAQKPQYRKLIETEYNIQLPPDRKLIYFVEDNKLLIRQLVYAANKLAKKYVVAFKPAFWVDDAATLAQLDPGIIVIRDKWVGNNIFRFAADFIIAGFNSGTFMSSVLASQPVIPCYTRMTLNKIEKKIYIPWHNYIRKYVNNLYMEQFDRPDSCLLSVFYKAGRFFDIVDVETIIDAIDGKEYLSWYYDNMAYFQNICFGDYVKSGAAKITADYIRRFGEAGTLGRNCAAIWLKNAYYANKLPRA